MIEGNKFMENNNISNNPNDVFFNEHPAQSDFNNQQNNENNNNNYTQLNPLFQKLHNKAFLVLMIAIGAILVIGIINIAISFVGIDAFVAEQMELMAELGVSEFFSEAMFRGIFIGTMITVLAIMLIYYGIMTALIFRHKKSERKGTYLTVMMVFAVLGIISGAFTIITSAIATFNFIPFLFSLISLLGQIAIVVGAKIHKKSVFDKLV